ncbi:amidohydrolase family protein [Planctomicrobium sp. SH668]|uniref:amidohydrolase family protein n=1 Tax=Planctomicrobium sp. SH668 TaxID=3448126 RepID=UPI003F5C2887
MKIATPQTMKSCCLSLITLLLMSPTMIQAQEKTVLSGATIIDGTGAPPHENMVLVIKGQKILGIVSPEEAPQDAITIDLSGKTIIPGLISAHSHVGQVKGATRANENYSRDLIIQQLKQFEVYGVTTIVALGMNQDLFYAVREDSRNGKISGADLFGADHGMGAIEGQPAIPPLPNGDSIIDRPRSAEDGRERVRQAKLRGADFIKIWVDDAQGTLPKLDFEVYSAIINEAHQQNLKVAAHVFTLTDAQSLVDAGVDIIAHGVRDQPVGPHFIASMKSKGVWYIPTLSLDDSFFLYADRPEILEDNFIRNGLSPELLKQFQDPDWRAKTKAAPATLRARQSLEMNQRNLGLLNDAGVKIGFGTDSGANPLRVPGMMEHRELQLIVQSGISPQEAILMATRNSAELLGLSDRGTIATGKLADLVVLDENPLTEITLTRNIHSVWHRGKKVNEHISDLQRR